MAKVDVKAEISPATAALVVLLVLAMSAFLLYHFVINQPPPNFAPPAIAPGSTGAPTSPGGAPAAPGKQTGRPAKSTPATQKPGT